MDSGINSSLKSWPLWLVIALGLIVATSVVGIAGAALMKKVESRTFMDLFERYNDSEIEMLAAAATEAIISEDVPVLESVIEAHFHHDSDLVLIHVFNEDGILLAKQGKAKGELTPYVLKKRNIKLEDEIFGRIEVGWRSDLIASRVESYAGRLHFFLVAILTVLTGVIIFLIHLFVVRPIRDIDRGLMRAADSGPASGGSTPKSLELYRLSKSVDRFHSLLRQKEKAVHEMVQSEALKAAVLSSSHDGIITIDEHNKIVEFNPASEEMFGFSREEAIGQDMATMIVPQESLNNYRQQVADFLGRDEDQGSGPDIVVEAQHRSGSLFPVEIAVKSFELEGHTYYTASIKDITERRKSEVAMRQARDEAEKANEAKSRFLATMSHEIRTPLNALININEILLDTGLKKKQEQLVRTGLNSGKLLSDIVDTILDFSKIESGNLDLVLNQFSPASAVSLVTDILALSAREKGIDLEVSLDSKIPAALIGDATRIRQILFNLVGNAIKFTNKGRVEVGVSLNSGQPEQGKVFLRFDIEDTGRGIREQDRKLLFTEFTRVGENRRGGSATTGTGLGLAISKKLIELMGGQVFVESKYGKGSHFWFVLPLELATGEIEDSSSTGWDITQDITGFEPGELNPANTVVLIVEDSAVNQMVIKSMLQKAGVSSIVADSGEQVLELLGTEKFDLILMDVGLPGIDGVETTRRIRAMGVPFTDIPIIALTAYAFTEDKQRCLDAGMNDYVRKPIDRDELIAAIRRQLQADNTDTA